LPRVSGSTPEGGASTVSHLPSSRNCSGRLTINKVRRILSDSVCLSLKKELGRLKLKQAVMVRASEKTRKTADNSDADKELKTNKPRSEASGHEADRMNEKDKADVDMMAS
jgi:CRISPR/Cas system-associated endonuclease Cas1